MTVRLGQNAIVLSGNCGAEEAEALLALLQAQPGLPIDIAAIEWVHTALWQVILAFKPTVIGEPESEFIRRWLLPLVTSDKPDTRA